MQNVGSVVIGALIALVGTVLVQLWLVPLVESRKRREQRWEADVRALGEALIFSEPEATSKVRSELSYRILLAADLEDEDPKRVEAMRREQDEALERAWSAHQQIRSQVVWLVDRVMAIAPGSRALEALEASVLKYRLAHMGLALLRYKVGSKPSTPEVLDQTYEALRSATKNLVDEVKSLANGRPPRRSTRIGQRLKSARDQRRQKGDQAFASPWRPSQQRPGRLERPGVARCTRTGCQAILGRLLRRLEVCEGPSASPPKGPCRDNYLAGNCVPRLLTLPVTRA